MYVILSSSRRCDELMGDSKLYLKPTFENLKIDEKKERKTENVNFCETRLMTNKLQVNYVGEQEGKDNWKDI